MKTNPIQARLNSIGLENFQNLNRAEVEASEKLFANLDYIEDKNKIDVSGTGSVEELCKIILDLYPANELCLIIWPFNKFGIMTNLGSLVQHLDDLWFPAQDDLLVIEEHYKWAFLLSHEEIIVQLKLPLRN
jgi:hypothetical protein